MENWKSEKNIEQFISNSFEALAKDFLERGHDFYVDAFTPKIIFGVDVMKKDKNIVIEKISLQCQTIEFEDYKEMICLLEEMGKDNYIFMFAIMPFQMRVATISCEYDIQGAEHRKTRLRDKKLNELLNE